MKFVRTKDKADLCSLVVIVVVAVEHVGWNETAEARNVQSKRGRKQRQNGRWTLKFAPADLEG